jgi:hypothetical protein
MGRFAFDVMAAIVLGVTAAIGMCFTVPQCRTVLVIL